MISGQESFSLSLLFLVLARIHDATFESYVDPTEICKWSSGKDFAQELSPLVKEI